MKKLILLLAASALVAPATSFAAKADGSKGKLIAKYDTNKNGKIDGDEVAALKKDFEADPKGDLAKFDTNHDGKLSDEEIAAITTGAGKKKSDDKAEKKSTDKKKKADK